MPPGRTLMVRTLGNDRTVEELLDEVMLEVWNEAFRYREDRGPALGWIATIARRRAIDRLRKSIAMEHPHLERGSEEHPIAA
jgi:RNA polymerase sigma-70 factor (ECF subfamily)